MKQLDPKAVWLFFITSISRSVALVFVLSLWSLAGYNITDDFSSIGNTDFQRTVLLTFTTGIVFVIAISYIWAKLTYRFYKYQLKEEGFRKELGVIYKQYVTIPYDRIQNVDIYRGILARILGLSDLNIQTAGSGTTAMTGEGRLPGLSKAAAEEVRDEILRRARMSRNGQGL